MKYLATFFDIVREFDVMMIKVKKLQPFVK